MVNLLIANSDILDAKRVVNTVVRNNKDLRLIDIVTNENEALEAINEEYPDVIIINKELFNLSNTLKAGFYSPIILHSHNIKNPYDIKNIIDDINTKKEEDEVKTPKKVNELDFDLLSKRILNDLLKLNFNTKMKGTIYLSESIAFSYLNHDENVLDNLSKYVYPYVGARHDTTGESVKWDVIKAINSMHKKNSVQNPELLKNFFKLNTEIKATPKFLIINFLNLL